MVVRSGLIGSSILIVSTLTASLSALAESSIDPHPFESIPSELASPWTTPAQTWLLIGAATTTFLWALRHQIDDPIQRDSQKHRPLGKFSKVGDYGGQFYPNAAYSVGMLTYGLLETNQRALDRSLLMFKASLYSISVSTAMKRTISEERPNNPTDTNSFPSGHTTAAFTFASFIAAEHSLPYGLAAFGLATLTGLSRINDNQHFLHDVVAGATIGTSYGLGISYLHAKKMRDPYAPTTASAWQCVPIFSSFAKGLALVGNTDRCLYPMPDPDGRIEFMKYFSFSLVLFLVVPFFSVHSARADDVISTDPRRCVLVSDWDDTIKISHSNSAGSTVVRGLFSDRLFAGAAEFINLMETVCRTYVLSDSPNLLRGRIHAALRHHSVGEPDGIVLRNWFRQKRATFKSEMLEGILAANPESDLRFVLIGDDTEQDPEIYADFRDRHPELDGRTQTFVHRVNQIPLAHADQVGFTVYPEIATALAETFAFGPAETDSVKVAFLRARDQDILPKFARCPEGDLTALYPDPEILSVMRRLCN